MPLLCEGYFFGQQAVSHKAHKETQRIKVKHQVHCNADEGSVYRL
jgi:hypothetical protein